MRVQVVDPSAYTPPYDHALCAALARAGAGVQLITSEFAYESAPAADGYEIRELFYPHASGAPGSQRRRITKLLDHGPDMLRFRRFAQAADVIHFQWLAMQWLDVHLLPPRPLVLTAHDLLPREARPGQARAQRRLYDAIDALVVHSEYGRAHLIDALGVAPGKVHVIHHGAFEHLTRQPVQAPLPPELPPVKGPVAMFFGLLRPYKGIETLLEAWRGIDGAQLWIVGYPRMNLGALRTLAPPSVHFVPRFVSDPELAACFSQADLIVLPYSRTERFDQSGVLATALAFGKPSIVSDIGGLSEIAATGAARLIPPDDPDALHWALVKLFADPAARQRVAIAAQQAAQGPYSWDTAAHATLALYRTLTNASG
jgi:glycosyltransferase involved in cell wall biosynthesis